MALTKGDKEFIELSLAPIVQRLDNFQEINNKQDERLEKLEDISIERGNIVVSMNEWHKTRGATCPQNERIETIEKVQNDSKVTKKFIIKIGAFLVGSVSITLGVIKIITLIVA